MRRGVFAAGALTALALAAVALVGCGGDRQLPGFSEGAASVVPADAESYIELRLQPTGATAHVVDRTLQRWLGVPDATTRIRDLLDEGERRTSGHSFRESVLPWLDGTVATFTLQDGSSGTVSPTRRPDLAWASLKRQYPGMPTVEYRGVDYIKEGRFSHAVIGGFEVGGTEPVVRASIDAARGGDVLSDNDLFDHARRGVPANASGFGYVDVVPALREALNKVTPALTGGLLGPLSRLKAAGVFTLMLEGGHVRVDLTGVSDPVDPSAKPLMAELAFQSHLEDLRRVPFDSDLAVALPLTIPVMRVGFLSGLASSFGMSIDELNREFDSLSGLGPLNSFLARTPTITIFVQDSPIAPDGGVIFHFDTPAQARRNATGLNRLIDLLPGSSLLTSNGPAAERPPVQAVAQGARVIAGTNEAVAAVLAGPGLGDRLDEVRRRAADYPMGFLDLNSSLIGSPSSAPKSRDSISDELTNELLQRASSVALTLNAVVPEFSLILDFDRPGVRLPGAVPKAGCGPTCAPPSGA
jgi:hypothetical protein